MGLGDVIWCHGIWVIWLLQIMADNGCRPTFAHQQWGPESFVCITKMGLITHLNPFKVSIYQGGNKKWTAKACDLKWVYFVAEGLPKLLKCLLLLCHDLNAVRWYSVMYTKHGVQPNNSAYLPRLCLFSVVCCSYLYVHPTSLVHMNHTTSQLRQQNQNSFIIIR